MVKNMEKERNSSIEFLKIIAVFLIILSHSLPFGIYNNYSSFINLRMCTTDITELLMAIFRYFGNIGNCIFMICSSYFLSNSNHIKKSKISRIAIYSIVVSILIFAIFRFIIKIDFDMSAKETMQLFMPITLQLNWFISCYIIIYLLHPLLNAAIKSLDKKHHFIYIILFTFVYSFLNTLNEGILFYNSLIGFILIYFIVVFLKRYKEDICNNRRLNIIIFSLSIITLLFSILLINQLGLRLPFLSDKLQSINKFNNPIVILLSISLFNLFNTKFFYNKMINYFSSLSLLIYIIHGNPFIEDWFKGYYYDHLVKTDSRIANVFILFLIYLFGSIFFATLMTCIEKKIKLLIQTNKK